MLEVGRRLKLFLALFLFVTAFGTVGFVFLEDLSLIDAFYYNIVTMSTVGYGDIYPTSQTSRLFAVLLIFMGGATFIGVIANTTEIIILKRETRSRTRKVNMLLGVFFSEVGYSLLDIFSANDKTVDIIREKFLAKANWTANSFKIADKAAKEHAFKVIMDDLDLENLSFFLNSKRNFLIRLLENPVLIEHENFSESLLSVFHLLDELRSRDGFENLPESDKKHLTGDIERVYKSLAEQWFYYLMHLKEQYPYLFSLAVRKNPFDPEATTTVTV